MLSQIKSYKKKPEGTIKYLHSRHKHRQHWAQYTERRQTNTV